MPEREHALLRPSGAHRYLNCTPSARMEEDLPDEPSLESQQGTWAHELASTYLRRELGTPVSQSKQRNMIATLMADGRYSLDLAGAAYDYADYVKRVIFDSDESNKKVWIEQRVEFADYAPEGFGHADTIVWNSAAKTLHVCDFKAGAGLSVSAIDNPQLRLYALGALNLLDNSGARLLDTAENVDLHIVQPRMGISSLEKLTVADLIKWGQMIAPIAMDAYLGRGVTRVGEWCQFCKARAVCRNYAPITELDKLNAGLKWDFNSMTAEEIGSLAYYAKLAARWYNIAKKWIMYEFAHDRKVPGWRLKAGNNERVWIDKAKAFARAKELVADENKLYKHEPISVAKMEQLLGKKAFNEEMADYTTTGRGPDTIAPDDDAKWINLKDFVKEEEDGSDED
jgi:hypothetical protein